LAGQLPHLCYRLAMMKPLFLDAVLPGAGLVVRGRLAVGLPCLVAAVLVIAGVVLAQLVLIRGSATPVTLSLIGVYVVLIAVAVTVQVLGRPPATPAAELIRTRHRSIAAAWLRGEATVALEGARELSRLAAGEPGAWRLVELIASRSGEKQEAQRAARRAQRLETLREESVA